MTINENVAYGLRMRGLRKKERKKWQINGLRLCNYRSFQNDYHQNYLEAKSSELHLQGLNKSKNFTIDEPLSALDANLRVTLREELRRIHKKVGTTLFVLRTTKKKR